MPHIHRLYDWVVSVFIVHRGRVLLCFHKKYREWLPIGGHVDLDEDPEEALFKEIKEECGLNVRILADRPAIAHPGVKPVYTPSWVDVHRIKGVHKHIALIYIGKASSSRVRLHRREHAAYKWLSKKELADPKLKLTRSIRYYCLKALEAAALCLLLQVNAFAEPVYLVVESFGSAETVESLTKKARPLAPRMECAAGTMIRTGPEAWADLSLGSSLESLLRVGPDSQVTFLNYAPVRLSLDKGTLLVLNEEQVFAGRDPALSAEVRVLTRSFLVSARQGGCALEAGDDGAAVSVFAEEVKVYEKKGPSYSAEGRSVEEGFRYSVQGTRRLVFSDYKDWQDWYKRSNERKDRLVRPHG